jgi:prevent-host-death family protein
MARTNGERLERLDEIAHVLHAQDMIRRVGLEDAKSNLSRLVDRAAAGDEIVIVKNGKPCARLISLPRKTRRNPGVWRGKVWIAPDFDAPLPRDLLKAFTG